MGPHTHLYSLVRRQSVAVSAVLSVALLVVQLGVMGWGGSFPTQDGPAHLHTAMIWRSLLLEENTLFHRFCELADYLPPNLLALVVLELLATLLNPAWAVSVLAVLSVLLLYGAVAYARRAVFPTCNPLDPSLNVLLPVLFLVLGLFNFYLGAAIALLAVGYLFQHAHSLKGKDYVLFALFSLLLYATHLLALLTASVVLLVGFVFLRLWPLIWEWPRLSPTDRSLRSFGSRLWGVILFVASLSPGLVLAGLYLLRFEMIPTYLHLPLTPSAWRNRFLEFVMALGTHKDAFSFRLDAVLGLMLLLIVVAAFAQWLRQPDSRAGAAWTAVLVLAVMFLVTPGRVGLGMFLAERMAWLTLLFAMVASGKLLASSRASTAIAAVLCLLCAVKLTAFATGTHGARRVLIHYEQLGRELSQSCTVLRINYPTPALDRQYGLSRLNFSPGYHAIDVFARAKRCFSWGNYQVLTGEQQFPVRLRREFRDDAKTFFLLEFGPNLKAPLLARLLPRYAQQLDYIVLAGESPEPGAAYPGGEKLAADFQAAVALIESYYELTATAGEEASLRLYRRLSAGHLPEAQS